jgi:type IV pilus assembly protein PilB
MAKLRGRRPQPEPGREAVGTADRGVPAESEVDYSTTPGGTRLGELLVDRKVVTSRQLVEALVQQPASGKRVGTLLVEIGVLDERTLAEVLAEQLGLSQIDLRKQSPDPETVPMLSEALARGFTAIPIGRSDGAVDIAVADPTDELRSELTRAVGAEVNLLVAPATDIKRVIDNSYRVLTDVDRHVQAFQASEAALEIETPVESLAATEAAPVIEVTNLVIMQGLRDRASDIHLEPQEGRVRVRFRIDGALHDALALPEAMGPALISRIKIMAGMNIVERRRSQDGQIATEIDGRPLDIRVATTATIWGEKAVLRLLDKSRPLYRLEELGMDQGQRARYSQLVRSPFGMVICAGPTGSGKTTSLYASLLEIQDIERNIMTIEDPVEYVIPGINQIQINEQADVTFSGGLKAILRQDPDVILVGEVRDVETARIAVQSALTGHLVLSSLHATDSVSALHRFLDMGIEPFLIASAVTGVLGQRLVRRICTHCKAPHTPTPDEVSFFREAGGSANTKFFHGEGCNFCSRTGYEDRIGIFELLPVTQEMKQLIVRHASHEKLMDQARKQGLSTLQDEGIRLVEEGITTVAEVVKALYTV